MTISKITQSVGALGLTGALMISIVPTQAQATQNIVEVAQGEPTLSTLVTAVVEAGLVDTLSDSGANYTVFAPTNDAFAALPPGTLDYLLSDEGQDDLVDILTYHVVDGEALAADLNDGDTLTTLNGQTLDVTIDGSGNVFINGNQVTTADVDASNGVVHILDGVLLPEGVQTSHSPANTGAVNDLNLSLVGVLGLTSFLGLGIVYYASRKPVKQEL